MEDRILTTLDYPNQPPVITEDAERINTLVRKGWTVRPDMPAYDPATQHCAWDGGQWVVSSIVPVVPNSVTMRQARLALLGAGKLALVDAAIDSMPEPNKSAARIEWEYSHEVQRDNGVVAALGPALGMTPAQIDQLFIAAALM